MEPMRIWRRDGCPVVFLLAERSCSVVVAISSGQTESLPSACLTPANQGGGAGRLCGGLHTPNLDPKSSVQRLPAEEDLRRV